MVDIKTLEKMLADGRDNALLRFSLGKFYTDNLDCELAVKHLEACLIMDESYSAAWKFLGKACLSLNDAQEARAVWCKGIEIAKKNRDVQAEKEMSVLLRRLEKSKLTSPDEES